MSVAFTGWRKRDRLSWCIAGAREQTPVSHGIARCIAPNIPGVQWLFSIATSEGVWISNKPLFVEQYRIACNNRL